MKAGERRSRSEIARALIVDDEPDIRELVELTLLRLGVGVDSAANLAAAKQHLARAEYAFCLTDMRLPDGDGLDLVRYIAAHYAEVPVAVITAFSSAENAVAALKAGAFDYVSKPVAVEQLRALVNAALKTGLRAVPAATTDPAPDVASPMLLGSSDTMRHTRQTIGKLARSQAPVYITGESGSGKELAARLIHLQGARADGPWVPVNCGAIPENLMESEFFGHKKGSFTGAHQDKDGFFQAARGGTLFLDEVAELPVQMQVKLLRAIQEKRVRKVGSTQEDAVDVRIISASHHDLNEAVKAGRFRQDLYYRLNVIELRMPALREISGDIPDLADDILRRQSAQLGISKPQLAADALARLREYEFPGNVRELENVLERALALTNGDQIRAEDLQIAASPIAADVVGAQDLRGVPLPEYLDAIERQAILDALGKTRFNRTAAARILGITFRALRYRMERLGIR